MVLFGGLSLSAHQAANGKSPKSTWASVNNLEGSVGVLSSKVLLLHENIACVLRKFVYPIGGDHYMNKKNSIDVFSPLPRYLR